MECISLTSITIPATVTSIVNNPFEVCINLKTIIVEETNSRYTSTDSNNMIIDKQTNTLIVGTNNSSIIVPDYVTSIGDYAFADCGSLASIVLPSKLTSIGIYAFGFCGSLTEVSLPEGLSTIPMGLFSCCTSLTSLYIPKSVTVIETEDLFYYCDKLTKITYGGTTSEWATLCENNWVYLNGATVTCSDGGIIEL